MKHIFIRENGVLTRTDLSNKTICGLYAAAGFNGETAGDLFVVVSGPILAPGYDKNGVRINVGADHAGQTYDAKRDIWYNE